MRFALAVLIMPLAVASFITWTIFVVPDLGSSVVGDFKWLFGFAMFIWFAYQQAAIGSLRDRLSQAEARIAKIPRPRDPVKPEHPKGI